MPLGRTHGQTPEVQRVQDAVARVVKELEDADAYNLSLMAYSPLALTTSDASLEFGQICLMDPTAGARKVHLPKGDTRSIGRRILVKNYSASTNNITVYAATDETIDELPTYVINTAWDVVEYWLVSRGKWIAVGCALHRPPAPVLVARIIAALSIPATAHTPVWVRNDDATWSLLHDSSRSSTPALQGYTGGEIIKNAYFYSDHYSGGSWAETNQGEACYRAMNSRSRVYDGGDTWAFSPVTWFRWDGSSWAHGHQTWSAEPDSNNQCAGISSLEAWYVGGRHAWHTTDGGANWTDHDAAIKAVTGGDPYITAVWALSAGEVYIGTSTASPTSGKLVLWDGAAFSLLGAVASGGIDRLCGTSSTNIWASGCALGGGAPTKISKWNGSSFAVKATLAGSGAGATCAMECTPDGQIIVMSRPMYAAASQTWESIDAGETWATADASLPGNVWALSRGYF